MSGNTSTDIWIAGAFAAFSVDLLVYPLDTLKTRIQSPDYRRFYTNEATGAIRKGALFRGLYQGITSVVIATLPSSGAFFTSYETFKSTLTRISSPQTTPLPFAVPLPQPLVHSAASALAECISCAILTPAEVIKQNAQMVSSSSPSSKNKISATTQTLLKFRSNPLALWRGYSALTTRNLPFTALQFPLFERLRHAIYERRCVSAPERRDAQTGQYKPTLKERGVVTAVSAGSAGALAAVLTTPIDVVKTRIMLAAADGFAKQDGASPATDAVKNIGTGHVREGVEKVKESAGRVGETAKERVMEGVDAATGKQHGSATDGWSTNGNAVGRKTAKPSSLRIAREVVAQQGYRGLWRGGALRGAWTMLGAGLYLGVYEGGKGWLEESRAQSERAA
ncbi:MAG: hypothetical protein M1831_005804 [Alyxoria varia]|nr:MAG: hypothetical protein M1831_005804 [Alyxoria varia]